MFQDGHATLHVLDLGLKTLNYFQFLCHLYHGRVIIQLFQNMCCQLLLNIFDSVLFSDCCLLGNIFWITLRILTLCLSKQALHHAERVNECFIGGTRATLDVIVDLFADLYQVGKVLTKLVGLVAVVFVLFFLFFFLACFLGRRWLWLYC